MTRTKEERPHNGWVYETLGISKHIPVKLQVPLIRAETLDNPLTARCFIYDVVCWHSFNLNLCQNQYLDFLNYNP